MNYSLHLCYGSIPDWHWFSMVTGDTILKVAASLSKFAVRTGSAAPEETKTAQEATAPAEAASTEEASAAEYGFNFSAQGFKMLSFQLKEPGSTEVIAGVATEEYVDYLEYLHDLYEEGLITDDAIEAIDLWSTAGDSTMTIPQAAQPGGDDMMEIFTMASDSLTYLSTVAPKVILGTATADDYRAAVEKCMNGMNLDVITERYQDAYDAYMGN